MRLSLLDVCRLLKAGAKPWRSPMNRSNSMSRYLLIFFLDLVTGEVKNPSSRFLHLVLLFYLRSLILVALMIAPIFSVVDLVRGKPGHAVCLCEVKNVVAWFTWRQRDVA
ncbi:hypothetical protein YC2023_114118 [Brassica napus]